MEKTGDLTPKSPCSKCGHPGTAIVRGEPRCQLHLHDKPDELGGPVMVADIFQE